MRAPDQMPDRRQRRWRGALILTLIFTVAALGIIAVWWTNRGPDVVGLWKGKDTHGHEHYFRFYKEGSLHYWDRERQADGSFTETDHRRGTYSTVDDRTISAVMSEGPAPGEISPKPRTYADPQAGSLGRLTLISPGELKQNDGGFDYLRHQVTYHRVAEQ